jgi:hypothetical protein
MTESKKLTRRQAAVIEDLFAGELDEQEVLEKHHVSPRLFERWFDSERFAEKFEQRIAHAQRQSRMILAQCAATAAAKLVQLTQSENQETARKACLDIISLHSSAGGSAPTDTPPAVEQTQAISSLSPETASRLLTVLAQGEPGVDSQCP